VAPYGLPEDLAIEGRHPFDIAGRYPQLPGDGGNSTVRYPTSRLLHYFQGFNRSGPSIFIVPLLVLYGLALGTAQFNGSIGSAWLTVEDIAPD
jgi:hypothetical protein